MHVLVGTVWKLLASFAWCVKVACFQSPGGATWRKQRHYYFDLLTPDSYWWFINSCEISLTVRGAGLTELPMDLAVFS
jgi:hypothetical protein